MEAVETIRHRGPDGSGVAVEDDCWLGHTRLAIQDLSNAAACPFDEGDIVLTYNGELWNADRIEVDGPFRTYGDTEIVAKVLDQTTDLAASLRNLDGMFALAWYDKREGVIRLTRDRWGKIPLYYAEDGNTVYWASEYHALPHGLAARAVPPGVMLEIIPGWGGIMSELHWAQEPDEVLEATVPNVLGLLRRGVRERLIGDRPIAYLLSGGLDSTMILHLALEAGAKTTCYTAVYDKASPDLLWARRVAKDYGVTLVEVPVPDPCEETVRAAVAAVEIPMKAQVEIALAHLPLMEAVRADDFAVVLSGEAADELFGGYGGMQIKAASADDQGYARIKRQAVEKMARGNFPRVNKVGMQHGVEARLPFMQSGLVELALAATKEQSPPGKKLLKEAALKLGIDSRVVSRTKETFQGGAGISAAAEAAGFGLVDYNRMARDLLGILPKE
jgi:asparagine synthase (glutamine-hydrolysing)